MESTVATLPAPSILPDASPATIEPGAIEHARGRAPVRKALSLSVLNTVIGRVGTVLTGIALARLLTPKDFGVYGAALVILNILLSLNELGVSLALVRWPGDPRAIAPTVTTISISASALLYIGCWFGAPTLADTLGAPAATPIIRVLCLAVVIDGLTATPAQLLNRGFRQGRRLVADTGNLVVTTAVTVLLAASGYGAWSLAIGTLVGNALAALLIFHLAESWPSPGWNREQASELLKFGLPLAAGSLLLIGMLNVPYMITGGLLGATALGTFVLAFNLSSWPVNVFSQVVRRVSLPAFSRVQDDEVARQAAVTRMAVLLATATLPACALLALLAVPVINTAYGHKWEAAATVLPFLAIFALVRVAAELSYDFLVALGRSRTTLWLQGLWLTVLVVALPVGAEVDGIQGVAIAQGAVALLVILPAYGIAIGRTGVSMRALLRSLRRPVIGCLLLAGVVIAVRALVAPTVGQLLLAGALGLAVYVPIVWPLRHTFGQLD